MGVLRRYVARLAKFTLAPILSPGKICMFHIGRTGSSVLADLLQQHPDVHWDGELYHRLIVAEDTRSGATVTQESAFRYDPLTTVTRVMRYAGWDWYGFEVKPYHLVWTEYGWTDEGLARFVDALRDVGFASFIVLDRRNRLRKLVSSAVAHARGRSVYRTDEEPELVRVRLGVEQIGFGRLRRMGLVELLAGYDRDLETLKHLLPEALHLTYEDHIEADPLIAYRAVCDFLGLHPVDVTVRHRKATPYPLEDVLENYEEVGERLAGTSYEWMLDEDRTARSAATRGTAEPGSST